MLNIIWLIISVFFLSQCTLNTHQAIPVEVTPPKVSVHKPLKSPYTLSATAYLDLAKTQVADEQASSHILAAGKLLQEGHWQDARRILTQMPALPTPLSQRKSILLANIDLIQHHPKVAIDRLASVNEVQHLSLYEQVQYHEVLARAHQALGHGSQAVAAQVAGAALPIDDATKTKQQRKLWFTLTKLPASELQVLAQQHADNTLMAGWVQLALLARQHRDAAAQLSALEQWQTRYPHHPAQALLPVSPDRATHLIKQPKQVALLLPLTGPLAGPGGAIKDGFMASAKAEHVDVRVYNANTANIEALYQQAINDGATYVVGPLSKTQATTIAALPHPVPTLLLNDVAIKPEESAYQLGLSPSHEASQVAIKAREDGYLHALIIAPKDSWGEEVSQAFAKQWSAEGGHIVDTLHFSALDNLDARIRQVLQVAASEARGKQLKQWLGQNLEVVPNRRQDVDVIFLLAYPSKARQIMPLLKYYYAGDIPVYATSSVYAGSANAMKDKDLNGLTFCDMPWVFAHQSGHKNWPEQLNSYNRLYALGMDSYALTTGLNQLLLFPAMSLSEKNGVLYLNSSKQVLRTLAWGRFKQGIAESISS